MDRRAVAYGLACATTAVTTVGYLAWRPRMLTWGATPEEAAEALPGDDRTAGARDQWTRAVTIDVPPEQVWPWIVQMGIHRGGFYTHDRVERLLFRARYAEGTHSATRIHPELQHLEPGDRIYMGGGVWAPVAEVEPNRHLVAFETFVLRPLPGDRTRLVVRYRGDGFVQPALHAVAPDAPAAVRLVGFVVRHLPGADLLARGFDLFVADPLHHYMDTGMLKGIKDRAEGAVPARGGPPANQAAIRAITAGHTLAWFSIETCMVYLLYAGFARRSDRRAALAAVVVGGETLVFAGNGFRCPLTQLAERLGATQAGVTDIWLPKWFAHNLPAIHAPLLVLAAYLHARNLRQAHGPA